MSGNRTRAGAGLGERLLGMFFPARCLLCGEMISPGGDLCESCRKKLPKAPYLRRYCLPGADGEEFRVFSPFSYDGECKRNIARFKFRGRTALAKPFGRVMAGAVPEGERFDAVAWVPLSGPGRKKRGYDQSELLAEAVAKALGLPAVPLLEKVRKTGVQHELSGDERRRNVKGAYRAKPEAAGKNLLLVDDIVTTGATLAECAGALLKAGALRVTGLCAADTPIMGGKETR